MTYDQFMDQLFWFCVGILELASDVFGMTYEELNVWLFVVGMPAVIIGQAVWIVRLRRKP